MMKRVASLLLLIASFAGCKLGPDYHRPKFTTPTQWREQSPTAATIADMPWWEFFQDPALMDLLREATTNNYDVRIAASRIEEARGFYRIQNSQLFPSVDATGGWTRSRAAEGGISRTFNQFDLTGLLSYEVDFWGRLRRLNESARAQVLAAEEGRQNVYISLVASVARAYFDVLALDEQIEISRRTLASRERSLELTRVKFDNGRGIVSELDVREAETQVYSAKATLADVERRRALRENELNLLAGRNPGPIPRGKPLIEQRMVDSVPSGLPSDLLLRRPDIRSAEQQLIAANANIGAARAAYFPTISLTAALGIQSSDIGELFNGASRTWQIGPRLAGPIFNMGRTRGGVEVARARTDIALVEYQRSIQNSLREVEDALISIEKLREQLIAQEKHVEAERARLELSELRYQGGVASYTEILDAQRFLFAAELQLSDVRSGRLQAIVELYRALGGGWPHGPAEDSRLADGL